MNFDHALSPSSSSLDDTLHCLFDHYHHTPATAPLELNINHSHFTPVTRVGCVLPPLAPGSVHHLGVYQGQMSLFESTFCYPGPSPFTTSTTTTTTTATGSSGSSSSSGVDGSSSDDLAQSLALYPDPPGGPANTSALTCTPTTTCSFLSQTSTSTKDSGTTKSTSTNSQSTLISSFSPKAGGTFGGTISICAIHLLSFVPNTPYPLPFIHLTFSVTPIFPTHNPPLYHPLIAITTQARRLPSLPTVSPQTVTTPVSSPPLPA